MRLAEQIGCIAAWTLRERGAHFQFLLKTLKHDLVQIYNWVHNNIAYGSIGQNVPANETDASLVVAGSCV
jgi:hypothetical protein